MKAFIGIDQMYEGGVPVGIIADIFGKKRTQIKTFVRSRRLKRLSHDEAFRMYSEHGETWVPVGGFFGYFVSSNGKVCSSRKGGALKLMTFEIDKDGYSRVGLRNDDGKTVHCLVHRLVALNFIPCSDTSLTVAHNDGSKNNNCVSNLRWASIRENHEDKKKHGTWQSGERHPMCKYSDMDVTSVKDLLKMSNRLSVISKTTGLPVSFIFDVKRGRRNTTEGYRHE